MVIKVTIENPHPLTFPSGVIVGAAVGKKNKKQPNCFLFVCLFDQNKSMDFILPIMETCKR